MLHVLARAASQKGRLGRDLVAIADVSGRHPVLPNLQLPETQLDDSGTAHRAAVQALLTSLSQGIAALGPAGWLQLADSCSPAARVLLLAAGLYSPTARGDATWVSQLLGAATQLLGSFMGEAAQSPLWGATPPEGLVAVGVFDTDTHKVDARGTREHLEAAVAAASGQ